MALEKRMEEEGARQEKEKKEGEKRLLQEKERLEQTLRQEAEEKQEHAKLLEERMRRNEDEKNEILQLYEKMRRENESRKQENEDLRKLLDKEKESLFMSFSRGTSEVRDMLEKEKEELKKKIDNQRKASAMLEQELVRNREDDVKGRVELEQMKSVITELHTRVQAQNSVYFNAVRSEEAFCSRDEH